MRESAYFPSTEITEKCLTLEQAIKLYQGTNAMILKGSAVVVNHIGLKFAVDPSGGGLFKPHV